VVERLGSYLLIADGDLGKFRPVMENLARESPLAFEAERACPECHVSFTTLYEEVRVGRNHAMHHGAVARNLAKHAQELALIMEDALMSSAIKAREFMVRNPTCAELWEPLSAIRRTMLLNAYSFLPVRLTNGQWKLLSDADVVAFTRRAAADRKRRLLLRLDEALDEHLKVTDAPICGMEDPIDRMSTSMGNVPWLVVDEDGRLLGLITAFDLL
jgi:CBS domain-containing protein